MISKRCQEMSVSGIRKVFELSQKLDNPVDLSIGKPDFPVPEELKDEALRAIKENKNDYSLTLGLPQLREKVAEKLNSRNHIKTDVKNIAITSAVSGGLSVVIPTIIDQGDEIVIFDPYFVGYKQIILLFGGVPKIVPKNEDFSLDIKELKNAISNKTKAIIVNTPENPTGHVWSKEELQAVVKIARENDLIIIADEIYEDFIYDKVNKHISVASMYNKVVTLGGFSKSHAITGWRIGYMCAPEEIINQVAKVQQYTFVCPPTPLQYGVLKAFDVDVVEHVELYKNNRDALFEALKDNYDIVQSQGAFYFFVKYPCEGTKFVNKCTSNNLLIVPGEVFSENNSHFRISFATKAEEISKAVKILDRIYV